MVTSFRHFFGPTCFNRFNSAGGIPGVLPHLRGNGESRVSIASTARGVFQGMAAATVIQPFKFQSLQQRGGYSRKYVSLKEKGLGFCFNRFNSAGGIPGRSAVILVEAKLKFQSLQQRGGYSRQLIGGTHYAV